jgi:hypothetical protein
MTEPTTPPADQTDDGQTEQQSSTYTPPATQADLDRIIADRVARTKNQFKDYAELKSAKAELDQIKQQNQTVEQRQAEELSNWQTEAQTWRTAAVGSRIEALAAEAFADPSDAVGAAGTSSTATSTRVTRSTRPPSRPTSRTCCPASRTGASRTERLPRLVFPPRTPSQGSAAVVLSPIRRRSSHRSSRANSGPDHPKGALDGRPALIRRQHSAAADHHRPDLQQGQRAVRCHAARPPSSPVRQRADRDPGVDGHPRRRLGRLRAA